MRKAPDFPRRSPQLPPVVSRLLPLAAVALAMSGCLGARAQVRAEVPLAVPDPPPRVVEVREPEEAPIVPLPDEPAHVTPTMPRRTPPPRVDSRPADPRPETPEPRPADEAVRTPPPTLQTTPTQQESEAERRIRLLLAQATADLNRINVQGLNADARQQFDTARRFVAQAEDAIRARNLVFATNLADKAAALAAQLAGR